MIFFKQLHIVKYISLLLFSLLFLSIESAEGARGNICGDCRELRNEIGEIEELYYNVVDRISLLTDLIRADPMNAGVYRNELRVLRRRTNDYLRRIRILRIRLGMCEVDMGQRSIEIGSKNGCDVCQKCQDWLCVADDSQDPGMCKKCQNGSVRNDNSEDPGICLKCRGGSVVNDDSETCNDGNSCTENDSCSAGSCTGTPVLSPVVPCN